MKLDVIHHNVRHWGRYKNDLSNYYLKHNADVLSLNSHGLDTNKKQFLKIFTYSNLTSGTGIHAGTALLTKTYIKHANFKTTNDPNSLYTILHTDIGKILIYSLYRPPRVNTLPLFDIQNALNLGFPTFIIGDFNIKNTNYGHTYTNDLGRLFHNFSLRNNLHFLGPDFKTYFNNINKGTPDLVFCNFPALHLAIHITPGDRLSASDHIPIHIQINSNPIIIPAPLKFNFNQADWSNFREDLASFPLPKIHNITLEQLDIETQILTDNIMNTANDNIPKTTYKLKPAFSESTKTKNLKLIYHQRHLRYINHMTPEKARILMTIKLHIDDSINHDFSKFWINKLNKIQPTRTNDPKSFFKNIRFLRGTGPHNNGTHIIHNNDIITDPQQQSEIFANTWENTYIQHTPNENNRQAINNHNEVRQWIHNNIDLINPHQNTDFNRLDKNSVLTKPIHYITVKSEINKIKSSACGPSGISGDILKQLGRKTILHITRILNAALSAGYFPLPFKKGTTYLIPKPNKDHTNPQNYRPITLLEPLAKVLEKIINKRLRSYLEETEQLNEHQYGFRSSRSIQDIIFYTTAFLDDNNIRPTLKAATCLDVEKAFDKVWWDGLVYKLHNSFNIPILINKLLTNYLHHRSYQITHKNCLSRTFTSQAGVPQGSAISPTLFILYTNDIPQANNNKTHILTYADDITILTENRTTPYLINSINNTLHSIINWQEHWLLKTNLQKSSTTIFNKSPQACAGFPPVRHNNEHIPFTHHCNILGVTFDNKVNFNKHIDNKVPLARLAYNTLHRFQHFHPKIRLHLFKIFVLPTLIFSVIPILYNGYKSLKKVQIFQNKHIRHVHSISWEDFVTNKTLHDDLNLPSTTKSIYKTFHRHYTKLLNRGQHIFYHLVPNTKIEQIYYNPPDDIF